MGLLLVSVLLPMMARLIDWYVLEKRMGLFFVKTLETSVSRHGILLALLLSSSTDKILVFGF